MIPSLQFINLSLNYKNVLGYVFSINRAIKRELRAIEYLFTENNFKGLPVHPKPGELPLNATILQNFLSQMMKRYCQVFDVECNQR